MVKEYYLEGKKCSTLLAQGMRFEISKEDSLDLEDGEADINEIMVLLLKYSKHINEHLIKWKEENQVKNYKILTVDYFRNELLLFIRYIPEENTVPA